MAEINRRQALSLGFAAATMAVLPAAAKLVPLDVAPAAVAPTPSWIVGTAGEYDWQHIVAKTELEARRIFAEDWGCYGESCEHTEWQEDCEFCEHVHGVEVQRVEAWDGKETISSADWFDLNMGSLCVRCSGECHPDGGARAVAGEAICEECMTLADWEIVDPDVAAEMRGEMEDEEEAHALFGEDRA